jgi:N-acetylglucosamine kinase-like BadF-type ATPase
MASYHLIADSGATKAEWCLLKNKKQKIYFTTGVSPYLMNTEQIEKMLNKELKPAIKKESISAVYYYGTGCGNPENIISIRKALKHVIPTTKKIQVDTDIIGAARALCGTSKGIACILGTGSNACYYNGNRIVKSSPGLGYILGDEGSGANMGRKVIQHFLYQTFDGELQTKFDQKFKTNRMEILDKVYRQPLPNKYMASFAMFLSENRGHYMIENIIEDSFNEFFYNHIFKFKESWLYPINFVGGVAFAFKDVLKELCKSNGLHLGKILKNPMEGLVDYHR